MTAKFSLNYNKKNHALIKKLLEVGNKSITSYITKVSYKSYKIRKVIKKKTTYIMLLVWPCWIWIEMYLNRVSLKVWWSLEVKDYVNNLSLTCIIRNLIIYLILISSSIAYFYLILNKSFMKLKKAFRIKFVLMSFEFIKDLNKKILFLCMK